jgi:V/A-type H+/Na+-transporting ATPase subunit E
MSETGKFTEDIMANAKEKADSIVREAENETQRASDEAKIAISREVDGIIRTARAEADAVKRRKISEARHRAKLREQVEKDKIMQDVLDQVRKRSFHLAGNDTKYIPLLTHLVETGIEELGTEPALIRLNHTDLNRATSELEQRIKKGLPAEINVEWSKEPIEARGGAVISSMDGRIRIVNTLDQRFEALEPRMLIEARRSLFAE